MPLLLEDVPTEIQLILLRHLDSIKTLFALLRASPRLLRVYQMTRDVTYTTIVCNHITPESLPVAITALRLRKLEPITDKDTLVRVLEHAGNCSELSIADWKQLSRFQSIVDETVQYSAEKGLQLLAADISSVDCPQANLSNSERYRLVRACYNRELLASICRPYLPTLRSCRTENLGYLANYPEVLEHLRCFRSLLETWTLDEFEELFFIMYHLRERLIRFRDQAEDDRFEEWKAYGPYEIRYRIDINSGSVWDDTYRIQIQRCWLGAMLYCQDLAVIQNIVTESQPTARMRHFEFEEGDGDWSHIVRSLRHHCAAAALYPAHLHDQKPRFTFRHDWSHEKLWEPKKPLSIAPQGDCIISSARWPQAGPDFDSTAVTVPWGAAVWDIVRLRNMGVLEQYSHGIPLDVQTRYDGDAWAIDEGAEDAAGGVNSRVWKVTKEWIAAGLMRDDFYLTWLRWPFCYFCGVDIRDPCECEPQTPCTAGLSVPPTGTVGCQRCHENYFSTIVDSSDSNN